MNSSKKPQTSENKATDVETNPKVEALYAKYGKLQVDREKMAAIMNQKQQEMIDTFQQIQKLEK